MVVLKNKFYTVNMKKLILLTLSFFLLFSSCQVKKKRFVKEKHVKVHVFKAKVQNTTETTDDDFLWYYLIYASTNNYYYVTSSNEVTSYDNLSWRNSRTNPLENIFDAVESISLDFNVADLPSTVQTDISTDQITEVDVADSQGDSNGDSSGDSNGDDGGSSDGGGSDGGDSGGGDGGGGDGGDGGGD